MPLPLARTDATKPDYLREEVKAAAPDLELIHDLLAGTRAMHAKFAEYIQRWPDEDRRVHQRRGQTEQLYEGLSRTLSAAVGKLFAKPPRLEIPAQAAAVEALWDDIDLAGTKGDVAAKWFARDAVADGYALILVDHTAQPSGVTVTAANERTLGLRPYWAFYTRAAVCSWRTGRVANTQALTQLVLHEPSEVPHEAFGVATVDRYRELWVRDGVAGWTLWGAPVAEGGEFVVKAEGVFRDRRGRTRQTLPVAIGYTDRTHATLVAKPPLLPVAWANLGHYQQAANLRYYRELAAFPQPVVIGTIAGPDGQPGELRMGPGTAVQLVNTGDGAADFKWAELSGSALEQVEAGVKAKEEQMAKLGMAFLQHDTRAAETAEAKRLDAAAEDSTLATAAQGLEDALNLALEHTAWYLGLEAGAAPTVTLNRDFAGTVLSPAQAQALAALLKEGMPIRTAVATLVAGGFIRATEDEVDAIAAEWEAGQVAARAEEAERMDALREAA